MKTLKIFFNAFRQLTFKKILRLLKLGLGNPILSMLTLYASAKAFRIAKKRFPKTASTDGVGNAFRHALWFCLIASFASKVHSPKKSVLWAERVTNLHEELFPNPPLQKKMDLHNNKVGLHLFEKMLPGIHRQFFETSFFVEKLLKMADVAVLVKDIHEFPEENQLLFIAKSEEH